LILTNILYLALCYLFVPKYGLLGVAYAQVVQALVAMLTSWYFLRREMCFLPVIPCHWSRKRFSEMIVYGANFQISSIMTMLYDPITKALLSKFGDLSMVGYYEMANRMVLQFRALLVSANQVLVPKIAELHEKDPDRIFYIYRENYRLLIYLALPFFSIISVFTPFISDLWIGQYQSLFVTFSYLLIWGTFIHILVAPAYFFYMGIGRMIWNTISHVVIAILNVSLGIVAGLAYGGMGVAWAWVVALVLGSLIIVVAFHMENRIPFGNLLPKESILLLIGSLTAALVGCGIYRSLQVDMGSWLLLFLNLLVFILLTIVPFVLHPMTSECRRWLLASRT